MEQRGGQRRLGRHRRAAGVNKEEVNGARVLSA
jgi:hypothetical protein